MTKETRMDLYVKGERVFAYVREKGSFDVNDVEIKISDSDCFAE